MIDDRYVMEKRPDPPTGVKLAFDQDVMPRLIDAAASLESALERLAAGTRRAPLSAFGMALAAGWLLTRALGSRRRRA